MHKIRKPRKRTYAAIEVKAGATCILYYMRYTNAPYGLTKRLVAASATNYTTTDF